MKGYGRVLTIGAISVGIILFTLVDLKMSRDSRASNLYGSKNRFSSLFSMPKAEPKGPEHDKATEKEQRRNKRYFEMRKKIDEMERKIVDVKASLDQMEREEDSHGNTNDKALGAARHVEVKSVPSPEKAGEVGRSKIPPTINHDLVPKFPDFKTGVKKGSKVPSILSKQSDHRGQQVEALKDSLLNDDLVEIKVFDNETSFKKYGQALYTGSRPSEEGVIRSNVIPVSSIPVINSMLENIMRNTNAVPPSAKALNALPGRGAADISGSFRVPTYPRSSDTAGSSGDDLKKTLKPWHGPHSPKGSVAEKWGSPQPKFGNGLGSGADADSEPSPALGSASKAPGAFNESPKFDDMMHQFKDQMERLNGGASSKRPNADQDYSISNVLTVFCEGFSDPKKAFRQGKCVFKIKQEDSSPASKASGQGNDRWMGRDYRDEIGKSVDKMLEKRQAETAKKEKRREAAFTGDLDGNGTRAAEIDGLLPLSTQIEEIFREDKKADAVGKTKDTAEKGSHEAGLKRDRKAGEVGKNGQKAEKTAGDGRMPEKEGDKADKVLKLGGMLRKKSQESESMAGGSDEFFRRGMGGMSQDSGKVNKHLSEVKAFEADGSLAERGQAVDGQAKLQGKTPVDRPGTPLKEDALPKSGFDTGKGSEFTSLKPAASPTGSPFFGNDSDDETTYSSEFSTTSTSKPVFKFLSSVGLSKKGSVKEELNTGKKEDDASGGFSSSHEPANSPVRVESSPASSEKTAKQEKTVLGSKLQSDPAEV